MSERADIERLLHDLYAARVRGDLAAICDLFTPDARFHIAGASNASPIAMTVVGVEELRRLLAIMVKTFKISDHKILTSVIDGTKAAVHWEARIFSRISGATVPTELVDVVETVDGRIASYSEFFAPT
jgi:ketosteroid isomerase-like protein